ncbi:MAG: DUF4330 domain-containing protein [Tissierellaceae bacterium]|nr:DUF4330 domain-containing protein [Tissierellaceae bacterium]
MKIINEKGKLFGLINIIDLSVVLILGLLIVGGAKRMQSKPIIVSESSKAHITYEVQDIRMVSVDNIEVGDPLYHYDKGEFVGTIVEKEVQPFTEPLERDGEWVNAEVPEKYTVTFKVEADVKDNPDVVVVGGEQTRVGIQYRLKNKKIAFFGTVLGIKVLE